MSANIKPIRVAYMEGTWGPPTETAPEAATQSFLAGAPLVNSSGQLAQAATNPTAIIGIALGQASGVQATPVQYTPALPDNLLFEVSVDGALSGGDAPGTGSLPASALFSTYGISQDGASENWYLDTSKSSANQVMRVQGFKDPAGTVNGRVYVRFLRTSATIYV